MCSTRESKRYLVVGGVDIEMTSSTEIGRYRSIMSKLVSGLATLIEQMEGMQQVPDGQGGPGRQVAVDGGRPDGLQIYCVLLLRRARLHAVAVLRANEACNAHSLGVQMRPALECAGQLALISHNLILEPQHGHTRVQSYMDADYYRTIVRATKGAIGHDQLLTQLAAATK